MHEQCLFTRSDRQYWPVYFESSENTLREHSQCKSLLSWILFYSNGEHYRLLQNLNFTAYVDYRFEFDTDIESLSKTTDFNRTLTVHPINDLETMLKLQK